MGFIFWAPSSRYVNESTPASKKIKKTGVFVDASLDYIQSILRTHNFKLFNYTEKKLRVLSIRFKNLGVEVIKAFQ